MLWTLRYRSATYYYYSYTHAPTQDYSLTCCLAVDAVPVVGFGMLGYGVALLVSLVGGPLTQVGYYLTSDWRMLTGSVVTLHPIDGPLLRLVINSHLIGEW